MFFSNVPVSANSLLFLVLTPLVLAQTQNIIPVGHSYTMPVTPGFNATMINYGTSMNTGSFSSNFRWQASGLIARGACRKIEPSLSYSSCFSFFLSPRGHLTSTTGNDTDNEGDDGIMRRSYQERNIYEIEQTDAEEERFEQWIMERQQSRSLSWLEKDLKVWGNSTGAGKGEELETRGLAKRQQTPRQRNEMYTWPPANKGEQWRYEWRMFVNGVPATTPYFFHIWQILRRDGANGPIISLGFMNGQALIVDYVRNCQPCVAIPISDYGERVITHQLNVTFGTSGKLDYRAQGDNGQTILSYSASGDMGDRTSMKTGLYRRYVNGMSSAQAAIMDFTATRVA